MHVLFIWVYKLYMEDAVFKNAQIIVWMNEKLSRNPFMVKIVFDSKVRI